MSTFWQVLVVIVVSAVVFALIIVGGAETPSVRRAAAQRRLMAHEAYRKNDGDVPIMMVNGKTMTMRPDGHWVEVEPTGLDVDDRPDPGLRKPLED